MSRKINHKRIYICMICMALLLLAIPVSASNRGSILLKATVEDEFTVYKLSNTEFMMYQVGTYKNHSWVLKKEFAGSGVVFDFEDSSAQAEAAKNWKNMYRITASKEYPERPIPMEKLCTGIWKKECTFLSRRTALILEIRYIKANLLS